MISDVCLLLIYFALNSLTDCTVPVSLTVSFEDVQYCITNTNLLPYLSTRVGRIRTKSKLKYLYYKTVFNIYEGTTLGKFLVEGKNQKTSTVGKG